MGHRVRFQGAAGLTHVGDVVDVHAEAGHGDAGEAEGEVGSYGLAPAPSSCRLGPTQPRLRAAGFEP
jgi:hypothetical protein